MRIATWNVNSLKARLEKVTWWLDRAKPDVLLMQETKLADADAPAGVFKNAGYELVHHGEGRWNGVAIASKVGIGDVVTNFGEPLRPPKTPDVADDEPLAEARMVAAVCSGVRVVSVYAPNGRVVGSPFYLAKLAWFERLARWLAEAADTMQALVLGGDFNVAPTDDDVWDPAQFVGSTHVTPAERQALADLRALGLRDVVPTPMKGPHPFTYWDYRAGAFPKDMGMRIDLVYASPPVVSRVRGAYVDREARKGHAPSDHAPVVVDLSD
jgi:exodeoxyribonuclease III